MIYSPPPLGMFDKSNFGVVGFSTLELRYFESDYVIAKVVIKTYNEDINVDGNIMIGI